MRRVAGREVMRRWPYVVVAGLWLSCEQTQVIEPRTIASVTVSPADPSIAVGASVQLQAAARDRDGIAFIGPEVVWRSDDPEVAAVSPRGRVTGVAPGTTVVSADVEGFRGSATVTVTLAPAIGLSQSNVAFVATEGSVDPPEQLVTISNTGQGALTAVGTGAAVYGAGDPGGWLTGALIGAPDTLRLRASVAGLAAGTYQARLPVLSEGASNSPQNVVATLTVQAPAPELVLSTSFVTFLAFGGGVDPPPREITVSNAGTGTLAGLAVSGVAYGPQGDDWLTVTVADSTLSVQPATGSLAPGTYLATVAIVVPGAVNSPQLVVGFTVGAAGPAIGLTSTTAAFAGNENGVDPAPATIDVVNIGSETLDSLAVGAIEYGPGQPSGWLTATLTGDVAPASLLLQPVIAGLPSGIFTALVPVSSTVAVNGTQTVSVTLELGGSDSVLFTDGGAVATVGTLLSPGPVVQVIDQFGAPVVGRAVTFTASGTGTVSKAVDTTDASGNAAVDWTVGTTAGTDSDTLTATLPGGLSAALVVSTVAGLPVQLGLVTQPGGAVTFQAWTTQPVVQVQDVFGNPVGASDLDVTATLTQGAGTLVGVTTVTTDAAGVATFTDLLVNDVDSLMAVGAHQVTFASGTLNPAISDTFTVGVSFAVNVLKVMGTLEGATATTCLACHSTYGSRANLVGQPTVIWSGCGTLVVSGDADASILYRKIVDDVPPCGARMPNPGDKLTSTRTDLIRDWILQGALNN